MNALALLVALALAPQEPATRPASRPAERVDPAALLRRMRERAEGYAGMEAELTQREFVAQLSEPIESRGAMLIDRRGNMRIEIREPRWSLLLARGERIEVYRGKPDRAEFRGVDPTGASGLLPLLGLPDEAAIARIGKRFEMTAEREGAIDRLVLRPRSAGDPLGRSVREVRFEVGAEDALPLAFEWVSKTGDRTRHEIAHPKPLRSVAAERFESP